MSSHFPPARVARILFASLALFSLAGPARGQADGAQRWAFATLSSATAGNIVSSPALGADGTVYIGVEVGASTSASPSGRLFAVNPNGTQKWVFNTPDWIDSPPAIASDGTVYFGCWDGYLYALRSDGTPKWKLAASGFITGSPALGADGTIYVGSGKGDLNAVHPDGTLRWTFPAADWIDSSPALAPDGTIYFGSWDKNLYALTADGAEKWRFASTGNIVGSPAIAADGTVYVGSRDQGLYALSPEGALKWRAGLGDTIETSPVLGEDGAIYVTTTGGRLFALSSDGGERWRFPAAGSPALDPIYSSPAVRSDGTVVFGTSNNFIYAVKADGTPAWRTPLGDWSDSSPLVTDTTIYLGCTDKRLYAFASSTGPTLTDWGQLHRDPQRTGRQPLGLAGGTTGRLINLSVRTFAGVGDDTLIVGFVAGGAGSRTLLVRGIGPTLAGFGVSGVLANPNLTAFGGAGAIAVNDDWGTAVNTAAIATTAATVGAFALPTGSLDAALLRDFSAGGYTVQVGGAGGATGVALMEIYDAGGAAGARLVNVSARSLAGAGADVLIAGFVVDASTRAVLVRGIGPALTGFGVAGALADPQLRVFRDTQLVVENNDWSVGSNATALAATAQAVGAFALPSGSLDAVLLLTLPPGAYTAQVSGMGGASGVALVEVYEVP